MGRGDGDASDTPESPTICDNLWQHDAKRAPLAMGVLLDRFVKTSMLPQIRRYSLSQMTFLVCPSIDAEA